MAGKRIRIMIMKIWFGEKGWRCCVADWKVGGTCVWKQVCLVTKACRITQYLRLALPVQVDLCNCVLYSQRQQEKTKRLFRHWLCPHLCSQGNCDERKHPDGLQAQQGEQGERRVMCFTVVAWLKAQWPRPVDCSVRVTGPPSSREHNGPHLPFTLLDFRDMLYLEQKGLTWGWTDWSLLDWVHACLIRAPGGFIL